jgi:putative transposase
MVGQSLGEIIPFLDYDVEIRRVICSTNAIESLNAPLPPRDQGPRALPVRTSSPQVSLFSNPITRPNRAGRARWTMRWKPALNAFANTFCDRFPAAETY